MIDETLHQLIYFILASQKRSHYGKFLSAILMYSGT